MKLELSVIAPLYNEQASIGEFYRRLKPVLEALKLPYEIIFIDDGSSDGSYSELKRCVHGDVRVRIIRFSRNFGHQVAVKAGIDHAQGQMAVIMDTDLQDAPEEIPNLIAKHREGFDVVYAVRVSREGESFLKKITAALYYRLIRKLARMDIPLDAGDFRLISRSVLDVLKGIHEKRPYIRGLVSWVGFRQTGITMHRQARFAGETKYSYRKMFALAWSGITHFSFLPLQLSTFVGLLTSILCAFWIMVSLHAHFVLKTAVPGWTSLMIAVLFLGSVQLVTLGIIGSYLGKNYDETRARPLYIVQAREGFDDNA